MAPALHTVDRPGPGPLVVLVHGSMDRSVSFFKAATHLEDLHVVMYDRRGYARSLHVHPPASGVEDHVDDLLSVLDERPAVVVGHSYGGVIGLAAAVRRPDLIGAVGTFEAPMPWMPWWPRNTAGGGAVRAVTTAADSGEAAEGFLRRMLGDRRWEALAPRTKADRRAEGAALVVEMTTIRQPPPPFTIEALTFPVVVGLGGQSLPHHRQATTYLADHVESAELVIIEGARHGAHASHPEEFAAFVRRAVERASPGVGEGTVPG